MKMKTKTKTKTKIRRSKQTGPGFTECWPTQHVFELFWDDDHTIPRAFCRQCGKVITLRILKLKGEPVENSRK